MNEGKLLEDIFRKIPERELKKIGDSTIEQMKSFIAKGISPIKSIGRFQGYKNAGVKGKYPANQIKIYPDKKPRPVNLKLSGDFLKSLKAKVVPTGKNKTINISFDLSIDPLAEDKELGHRNGAGGQPKRPILPDGNEELNVSIERMIEKSFSDALDKFFK